MKCEVPGKLIGVVEWTLTNIRARVKINNEYRDEFKVESGEKQGAPLSAALFSIVIDAIFKQLDWRGNIYARFETFFCLSWSYIDKHENRTVTDTFQKLKNWSVHVGLIVTEEKLNI